MKSTFKILTRTALALILGVFLASCGAPSAGNPASSNANAGSSAAGNSTPSDPSAGNASDVEILDFSVGYLTESAYNGGSFAESAITQDRDFANDAVKYLVVDFKIKALKSNDGDKSVSVLTSISNSGMDAAVQDAPTGKLETEQLPNGSLRYTLTYSAPTGNNEEKAVRMILKLSAVDGGNVDVSISVAGSGTTTAKGAATKGVVFLVNSLNLAFTLQNEEAYTVSGTGSCASTQIVIPNTYNGKPVTAIEAGAFKNCDTLKSVIIPSGVTAIGDESFYGCSGLTELVIPEGLTDVGDRAFYGCTALTELVIPDRVTDIGDSALGGCTALTSLTLPFTGSSAQGTDHTHFGYIFGADSYSKQAQYVPISLKTVILTNGSSVADHAFFSCSGLTDIDLPDGVTAIGNEAFRDCTALTGIDLPDSVTAIGDRAFSGCHFLTGKVIPDGVKTIGKSAFEYCGNLTDVRIPDGIVSIGSSAFIGCTSLNGTVDENAFYLGNENNPYLYLARTVKQSVTFCSIHENTRMIDPSAFQSCNDLTEISVHEGNANFRLENGVLFNRDQTELICYPAGKTESLYRIPYSVTRVGDYAFHSCSVLSNILLHTGITYIGDHAFLGCHNITSIEIPSGVTYIGDSAFSDCDALTEIRIPENVAFIGDSVFSNCDALEAISVHEGNAHYRSESGVLFNKEQTKLICYPMKKQDSLYRIPDGVTEIIEWAFYGNTALMNLGMPDSVTKIGEWAFYKCTGLTDVTLSSGLTDIGKYVFRSCTSLSAVTLPDSVTHIDEAAFFDCQRLKSIVMTEHVTSIGNYAFSGCYSLASIYIPEGVTRIGNQTFYDCDSLESIILPSSVTEIGDASFHGCNRLTELFIPQSVTWIGDRILWACNELDHITYGGTTEQWNAMERHSGWDSGFVNYTVVCTDGRISK